MGSNGSLYEKVGSLVSEAQSINQCSPASSINNNIDRIFQMKEVHKEALEIFSKKNSDYGDAFANYGAIGVLVRMQDKISRCQSISNNSITMVNSESLRDTLLDLHNYSAMAIMLLDESEKNKVKMQRSATTTNDIVNEVMKGNIVGLI